jgi:hypothetical protein
MFLRRKYQDAIEEAARVMFEADFFGPLEDRVLVAANMSAVGFKREFFFAPEKYLQAQGL